MPRSPGDLLLTPVATGADDGFVAHSGTTYPPATASQDTTGTRMGAARSKTGSTYTIKNGLARWNTSSIGANSAVSTASFSMRVTSQANGNSRALTADWYTAWPIDSADYTATAQTSASGASGWALSQFATPATYTVGLQNIAANVSRTGYTGLRFHVSGSTPTADNAVNWATVEDAGYQPPNLVVNYALPPTLDSPTPGASLPTATPVLKATTDAGDSSAIDYNFVVGNMNSCSTGILATSNFLPNTNTWTVPTNVLQPGGTYYWCAQARVSSGQMTSWTGPQSFSVQPLRLGARGYWPIWSHGPVSVNETNGNLITGAPGPSYPTAAGSMSAALSYNSLDVTDNGFGPGWALQAGDGLSNPPQRLVDHSVLSGGAKFDAAEIVFPDDSNDFYTHVGTSNTYASPPGDTSSLTRQVVGAVTTWTLVDADGSIYTFQSDGVTGEYKLASAEISDASPGLGKLTYAFEPTSPTKIHSITDTAGRTITFNWNSISPSICAAAIVCVGGPDGVTWRYVGSGGGTSGALTTVNDGTRNVVQYSYTSGVLTKIQNANDLDPTHASPGYDGTHAVTVAYTSGKVSSVTDGPVSDQTPSSSTWSISYVSGLTNYTTPTATRADHSPVTGLGVHLPVYGYTQLTPPNQQGTQNKATVYFDNLGHPVETDDLLGHATLADYNANDQILWSEDALGNPTDNTYDVVDN